MDAFTYLLVYSSSVFAVVLAVLGICELSNRHMDKVGELKERLKEIRREENFYGEEAKKIRLSKPHYKEDDRYRNAVIELRNLEDEKKKIIKELADYGENVTIMREATDSEIKKALNNPYGEVVRDLSKEKKKKD